MAGRFRPHLASLMMLETSILLFGLDRRVQTKDYFFHNANSAIRKLLHGKNTPLMKN